MPRWEFICSPSLRLNPSSILLSWRSASVRTWPSRAGDGDDSQSYEHHSPAKRTNIREAGGCDGLGDTLAQGHEGKLGLVQSIRAFRLDCVSFSWRQDASDISKKNRGR